MKLNKKTDIQIINLYKKNGDEKYVGELFKRYTDFVFLVSMKYLKNEDQSKDAVMEIFEKLFIDLKKHEVTNFKSWLYTVIRNHCFQKFRKSSSELEKHKEYEKDTKIFMESETNIHLINENEKEQQLDALTEAINKLEEKQKICIKLFYLQEKSYKEIVKTTNFELKKVKSYIQNAKRNLKLIINEELKMEN